LNNPTKVLAHGCFRTGTGGRCGLWGESGKFRLIKVDPGRASAEFAAVVGGGMEDVTLPRGL
jgi:hypothetical protein